MICFKSVSNIVSDVDSKIKTFHDVKQPQELYIATWQPAYPVKLGSVYTDLQSEVSNYRVFKLQFVRVWVFISVLTSNNNLQHLKYCRILNYFEYLSVICIDSWYQGFFTCFSLDILGLYSIIITIIYYTMICILGVGNSFYPCRS